MDAAIPPVSLSHSFLSDHFVFLEPLCHYLRLVPFPLLLIQYTFCIYLGLLLSLNPQPPVHSRNFMNAVVDLEPSPFECKAGAIPLRYTASQWKDGFVFKRYLVVFLFSSFFMLFCCLKMSSTSLNHLDQLTFR